MPTRSIERAALAPASGTSRSGTLFDRLEKVHGDRQLVTEADGGLALTYAQAAKRVRRWAGGHRRPDRARRRRRRRHAQRLRAAAPLLRRRPGRRAPGAGQRPDAPGRGRPRRPRLRGHARRCGRAAAVDGADSARRRRTRPSPTTWRRSSTRRAPPARRRAPPSRTGRSSGQVASAALWPTRLHRDEAVIALPGRPHHGLRRAHRPGVRRHPDLPAAEVQPGEGARRHRAAPGARCSSACPPCTGCSTRPTPPSATSPRCGCGRPAPTPCRPSWPSGSRRWAPRSPSRCSAPWARPPSPRATAWSRSAAAWPPSCRRRSSAPASGPARRGPRLRPPGLRDARRRRRRRRGAGRARWASSR